MLTGTGSVVTQSRREIGLADVVAIALTYGLIHGTARFVASPNLGEADSLATVYAQGWSFGYTLDKPPLYVWLLRAVETLTGPGLTAVLVLKYSLLTATAIFAYLTALRIVNDRRWAALTAFSLSLSFEIGWSMHEGVTYTAALMAMVMATLWSFLRLDDRERWFDYVFFGICSGFGLLSNYNFIFFLIILISAASFTPSVRDRLFNSRTLVSLLIMFAIITPFSLWLMLASGTAKDNPHAAATAANSQASTVSSPNQDNQVLPSDRSAGEATSSREAYVGPADANRLPGAINNLQGRLLQLTKGDYLHRSITALANMFRGVVGFLAPLIIVVPLIFPGTLKDLGAAIKTFGRDGLDNDDQRLLLRMTVAALVLLIAAVGIGFDRGGPEYMHPLLLPTLLLLPALAKRQAPSQRQVNLFGFAILGVAGLMLSFRLFSLFVGPPHCGTCLTLKRFEPLADALRHATATNTTLLTNDRLTAGNLHRLLPPHLVLVAEPHRLIPLNQFKIASDSLAIVTRVGEGDEKRILSQFCAMRHQTVSDDAPMQSSTVTADWSGRLWAPDGIHKSGWQVSVYPAAMSCGAAK